MGCLSGKDCARDEKPVEPRSIAPFRMGRYEVTFAQYDQFIIATRPQQPEREHPDDKTWGCGARPVINVSWEDARAYVDWLAAQTGKGYRLPTEAEWEYAARGGTQTRWSSGDDEKLEDFAWYSENSGSKTHPVGKLKPNPWCLFDMHGNVEEWVRDCWHDNYAGAPDDGTAWESSDCDLRVLRGGSWLNEPRFLRSADRNRFRRVTRFNIVGFRVAQD